MPRTPPKPRQMICVKCGITFTTTRYGVRFCSKACPKTVPLEERFWTKVAKGPNCWEWTGCRIAEGYGRIRVNDGRGSVQATHASWFLTYGEWPVFEMCHRCDNPSCVRPDHLFPGTHHENMTDSALKGRTRKLRPAPITDEVIAQIRALRDTGMSQTRIAQEVGVGQSHISRILRGKARQISLARE